MSDPNPNPNPDPQPPADPGKDLAYWQNEAKKAFADRDAAKRTAKELESKLLSDDQLARFKELEAAAEQAEEDRKKKAGEFDAWRTQIGEKHDKALKAEQAKTQAEADGKATAIKDLHDTLIGLSFAGASEWFGGDGKTVLTPAIAQAYFGRHVEVQTENGTRHVVVKDLHGNPILDTKTGRPMPFEKAIGELIDAMPDKDRILRGSGKAGSGNSGGAGDRPAINLSNLTPEQRRDPKVLKQLRDSLPRGGVVMGEAYN